MAVGTWTDLANKKSRKLVSAVSGGSSTEDAPTTDATYGVYVGGVRSGMIIVEAASGQTLSGTGTLDLYVYDYDVAAWVPCYDSTGTLVTLAVTGTGRRQAFLSLEFQNRQGRFAYIPNTVAVGGGSTVTVYHVVDAVWQP